MVQTSIPVTTQATEPEALALALAQAQALVPPLAALELQHQYRHA